MTGAKRVCLRCASMASTVSEHCFHDSAKNTSPLIPTRGLSISTVCHVNSAEVLYGVQQSLVGRHQHFCAYGIRLFGALFDYSFDLVSDGFFWTIFSYYLMPTRIVFGLLTSGIQNHCNVASEELGYRYNSTVLASFVQLWLQVS